MADLIDTVPTYAVEITLPNGKKLPTYRIDRDAFVIASDESIGVRLAADIIELIKQTRG